MTSPPPPAPPDDDWTAPRTAWRTYKQTAGLDHGMASWSSDHAREAFMAGWKAAHQHGAISLQTAPDTRPDDDPTRPGPGDPCTCYPEDDNAPF
jgi:hypothetical protein